MSYIQEYWEGFIGKKVIVTQKNGIIAEGLLGKIADNYESESLQKIELLTTSVSEKVGNVKPENKYKTASIYALNIKTLEVVY